MKYLDIHNLPPTMRGEAEMIRAQILQELDRSRQQREQAQALQHKLATKAKRRIRKAQRRKGAR